MAGGGGSAAGLGMELPILFPRGGLSIDQGFANQPEGTTPAVRNMRPFCSVTGRRRGAKRPGTRKLWNAAASPGADPVKDIGVVVFEERRVDYALATPQTVEWEAATPANTGAVAGATDAAGNVFTIDGQNNVAVYNTAGELIHKHPVQPQELAAVIRALHYDRDGNMLMVAVSEGGASSAARIYGLKRDNTFFLREAWQLDAGGFVERLRTRAGLLYALVNDPTTGRSYVAAWRGYTTAPAAAWSRRVPYPARDFDVRELDGALLVASPANADRNRDPRYTNSGFVLDDDEAEWRVDRDLPDFDKRVWARLRAEDSVDGVLDNDPLTVFPDSSGNGRALTHLAGIANTAPPFLRHKALNGRATVDFAEGMRLESAVPLSAAPSSQRALLPIYKGGSGALFMVLKAKEHSTNLYALHQGFWADTKTTLHTNTNYFPGAHIAIQNGTLTAQAPLSKNPTPGMYRASKLISNPDDVAIVSVTWGSSPSSTQTSGQWFTIRINGEPLYSQPWDGVSIGPNSYADSSSININSSSYNWWRTVLGFPFGSLGQGAHFEVAEILVLHATERSALGNTLAVEDYHYPDAGYDGTVTEMDRIEGYLAWYYGVAHLLDDGAVSGYPHPFRLAPPARNGAPSSNYAALSDTSPMLVKFDKNRDIAWVAGSNSADYGGVGDACAWDKDGNVFSVGPRENPAGIGIDPSRVWLRKLTDNGTSFTDAWAKNVSGGTIDPTYSYPRIATDAWGNVFVPFHFDTFSVVALSVEGFAADGFPILEFAIPGALNQAHAVALPPSNPDYGDNPAVIDRPEFLYLFTRQEHRATWTATLPSDGDTVTIDGVVYTFRNVLGAAYDVLIGANLSVTISYLLAAIQQSGAAGLWYHAATVRHPTVFGLSSDASTLTIRSIYPVDRAVSSTVGAWDGPTTARGGNAVFKVRLVNPTPRPSATRIHHVVTVAGGDVRARRDGNDVSITGGSGALSAAARYVASCDLFGERFFTDGVNYRVYRPRQGDVIEYASKTSGEIPRRCKLIAPWRGAIMLANNDEDPQNWHLSRRRYPYDWDQTRTPATSDMSISGNNSRVGRVPDVVNALVPWSDDLLLFGCDKSWWRLTGDPMLANSSIDSMNVDFGACFGESWCRDPSGALWLLTNQGDLMRATPGGGFEPVSRSKVRQKLRNINLSQYHVRMSWNWRHDGIYIVLCPFGDAAGDVEYMFYDARDGGFWPDDRFSDGHAIHSMCNLDGDLAQDREQVFGCEDGYVRCWNDTEGDDDGDPIDAVLDLGPISVVDQGSEIMLERVGALLDPDQGGALLQGLVSQDASRAGELVVEARIDPGMNDTLPFRARGNFVTVRLRSSNRERMAIEKVWLQVADGGMRRKRR